MLVSYYLHKFFKFNESQTKNFLNVNISSKGLFLALKSLVSFQGLLQGLKSSL